MKKFILTLSAFFFFAVSYSQIIESENDLNNEGFIQETDNGILKNDYKHNKFHRISLRIGGGPYYHYGKTEFPKYISFNFISFQGEGMLGFNFKTDHWPIHTIGVFARRGITNKYIDPLIITQQELMPLDFDSHENFNMFEEYEAGLLIGRWFRFSAGLGQQYMYTLNNRQAIFNYYTFTSGFCFGTRNVRWSFNFTAAGGNDYQDIHFRLYTGINLYLNLLKL